MVRLLSVFFAVVMLVSFASTQSFAADDSTIDPALDIDSRTINILAPQNSQAPSVRTPDSDGPTLVNVLPGNNSTSGNGRAPQGGRLYNNSKYIITGTEMTNSLFTGPVLSVGWQWNLPSPPAAAPPVSQSVATTGNLRVYLKDTSATATTFAGTFIDTNGVGYTKVIDATISIPTGTAQIDIDVPVGGPGTSAFTPTPGNGVLVIYVYNTTTALSTPTAAPIVHCNTTVGGNCMVTYQSQLANGATGTTTTFRPATRFGGAQLVDYVRLPVVYALGKIPIPYGVPQTISTPVMNVNATTAATVDVTLTVKDVVSGTVRFTNTQTGVFVDAGDTNIISFPPWTPTIIENDSIIIQSTVVAGEEVISNNRVVMVQSVNANRFAYSQGPTPAGGVGFTGATGDFVAKFTSGTSAVIDSIQVNFNAGGQPYQLGIWDATGVGGTPGTNVYTSAPLVSAVGVVTIAISPAVVVNGDFYLGVKQTGTVNVSFSYQSETPIRPGKFYFTSPSGGTTWTDFSPGSPFRFMIEANIAQGTQMVYTSSTATQNSAPVLPGSMDQHIIGMQVVTTGNLLPVSATSITFNTAGSTNPATDLSNAKIYYTGASSTFAPLNQFGTTVASPSGSVVVAGSRALVSGTNYFWLTYDINPTATIGNVADAEFSSVTVAGTPETPTETAPAGSREIKTALAAGDYIIGLPLFNRLLGREVTFQQSIRKVMREVPVEDQTNSLRKSDLLNREPATSLLSGMKMQQVEVDEVVWTMMDRGAPFVGRPRVEVTAAHRAAYGIADNVGAVYPTITAALDELNGLGISGPVRFLLEDTSYPTETFPLTINQVMGGSSTNTVTIRPQVAVSTSVSGSSASSIFKLNGADYVTIDGSNSGGTDRSMLIMNTNAAAGTAVVWIASIASPRDSATNNTIKNCAVLGATSTTTLIGIVTSGASLGGVGNAQNINTTIRNNETLRSQYGIAAVGPTANEYGLLVTQNLIGSATVADKHSFNGIALFQQGNAVVSNNTIQGVLSTTSATASGIRVSGTADSIRIIGNTISDIRNSNAVGWGSNGIQLNSSVATAKVTVANNMIWDVSAIGFNDGTVLDNGYGIIAVTGGPYRIYYNSVNMNTNHDSLNSRPAAFNVMAGIPANAMDVRNNNFANTKTLGNQRYAIYSSAGDSVFAPINNNNYFTTGPNLGFLGATNRADLAAWQAATGEDANSVSGDPMYVSAADLHITNPSSPSSNAGTPIASVTTDYDGESRSGSTPDIGADEFGGGGTTTIGVSVALNWNIVSLPVTSPIPGDSVKQVYTNSINPYAFAFTGSYQQRFIMLNAPGYWIKSSAAYTQDIVGTPLDNLTVPVNNGWNMIGSISTAIDTSAAFVTPSVPGLRGSNYFRYSAGYVITSTITPGLGFWVKANSAGSFLMHSTGASKPLASQSSGRTHEDLNSITIQDANGGSQTLYFGADSKGEIPVAMFAMPPSPPVGSFDARFASADGGTMVQTHAEEVSEVLDLPISIQSMAYPLTVSWNISGSSTYELNDGAASHPMRGEGTVKITNSSIEQIVLKVTGGSTLPKEFALSQNYPNPFNPTTSVKYALPVDSRVTMEIYNVIGQRVRTLVNDNLEAGYHAAEWNGKNNAGQQLSSGMYFLQLSARGTNGKSFNEVRKLMMLK